MDDNPKGTSTSRTSTHRVLNNGATQNPLRSQQEDVPMTHSSSSASTLKIPDIGRAVTHLEHNLRRTFGAAKRSIVSASKSISCVSVVPNKDSTKGEFSGGGVGHNDESASDDGGSPILSRMPTGKLYEKAARMAEALEVVDRQHHLKVYRKCFLGTHAVEWMIREGLAADAEAAVELGNRMQDQGLLTHVTGGHNFEDKDFFYRFSDTVMQSRGMNPSVALVGSEVVRIDRRLAHLQSQLKLHRSLNVALFEQASEQKQKLEDNAEILMQRVASLEFSLAVQFILSGLLLIMFMQGIWGLILKGMGLLMMWFGARALVQGQDDDNFQQATGENPDMYTSCDLLDQLRGAGSLVDGADSGGSIPEVEFAKTDPVPLELPVTVAPPTQEDYASCPDRPCLLRLNRSLRYQKGTDGNEQNWVRMNTGESFGFETRIFKGCAVLYVAGLNTSPPGLFQGRKRKTHLVVQGRFKRPMRFTDVLTGQEFTRKLQHIPANTVLNLLLRMAKRMSPSMLAGLEPRPHILAPVAAGAQIINCSKPGEQPALDNPLEDMRLLGDKFKKANGDPLSGPERKRVMSDRRNHAGLLYDTESVWTFHFWQHLLDLSSFKLDMSLRQFSLSGHLDGQPLQLMAKDRNSEEYIWCFEAWHESLLSNSTVCMED